MTSARFDPFIYRVRARREVSPMLAALVRAQRLDLDQAAELHARMVVAPEVVNSGQSTGLRPATTDALGALRRIRMIAHARAHHRHGEGG